MPSVPGRGSPLPPHRYCDDVLAAPRWRGPAPADEVAATAGLVVEDAASGWCGAVVDVAKDLVVLEDRHGKRRAFPLRTAGFLVEGRPATLVRPRPRSVARPTRTASGSVAVPNAPARVARSSRLLVEGLHDAALVERVWGDDLRIEGVVVEVLDGVDALPATVSGFRPGPGRRLGVLVDHLVSGSKESAVAARCASAHVLVTGHPYVDIWQAVKPAKVGIKAWPRVPPGIVWKDGVCAALGWSDRTAAWRRILSAVQTYADLEVPLLQAVERLVDFVTDSNSGRP